MKNLADTPRVAEQFKQAMRHLAATVTIISTEANGTPYGMTATAVTSVSMEPPSILVAVNMRNAFHRQVTTKGAFCINLLTAEHTRECQAFGGASSHDARFAKGDWGVGPRDLPFFKAAEASIFCVLSQAVDHGTHTIFIGEVENVVAAEKIDPLIYLNGAFLAPRCRQPATVA